MVYQIFKNCQIWTTQLIIRNTEESILSFRVKRTQFYPALKLAGPWRPKGSRSSLPLCQWDSKLRQTKDLHWMEESSHFLRSSPMKYCHKDRFHWRPSTSLLRIINGLTGLRCWQCRNHNTMAKTSSKGLSLGVFSWQTIKRPLGSALSGALTHLTMTQYPSSTRSEHLKNLFRKKRQFSNTTQKTRAWSRSSRIHTRIKQVLQSHPKELTLILESKRTGLLTPRASRKTTTQRPPRTLSDQGSTS